MEIIEEFYYTFVFHNPFWKLCVLLALLIAIDFQVKFKILISGNNLSPNLFYQLVPKKGGGNLKSNLLSYHIKYVFKLGNLKP